MNMKADTATHAINASLEQMADVTPGRQVSQQLADKFSALMQKAPMAAPTGTQTGEPSLVSKLVSLQDAELQTMANDVMQLNQQLPGKSISEVAGAMTKVITEAASTTVDLSMKTSVMTSSKSALETLMKNQ